MKLISMTLLSLLLSLFSFSIIVAESSSVVSSVCPSTNALDGYSKYHATSMCDRRTYNYFKRKLGRCEIYKSYKSLGGCTTVPNEKTIKCPAAGARVNMNQEDAPITSGMDTIFIIENQSSTPVVISYVNEITGLEVSAFNIKISPAIADPNAILLPGTWKNIAAYEGHEFVVRQVLKNGVAGDVLLQHRPGLIPIGMYSQNLQCPSVDIEPIVNNTLVPEFRRTLPIGPLPCNAIPIGFRNMANCPLHGYYVSSEDENSGCTEQFKFHLGVETTNLDDYQKDWISATKFESTYIGHTFHFRLASDPTILVDTVTMKPVIVTDCPKTTQASISINTNTNNIATQISNPTYYTNGTISTSTIDDIPISTTTTNVTRVITSNQQCM